LAGKEVTELQPHLDVDGIAVDCSAVSRFGSHPILRLAIEVGKKGLRLDSARRKLCRVLAGG
jgi:hypothetical protein